MAPSAAGPACSVAGRNPGSRLVTSSWPASDPKDATETEATPGVSQRPSGSCGLTSSRTSSDTRAILLAR